MTTPGDAARRSLTEVLRHACSGELAAARAYDLVIRDDELEHRARVGEMLAELGGTPSRRLEIQFWWIGTIVSVACRAGSVLGWIGAIGWFAAMWGAGKLERGNIIEYERAAVWARDCGREGWVDELLHMAEVEWDHELYFRSKAASHWLARWVWIWPDAGPRGAIRDRYAADTDLQRALNLPGAGADGVRSARDSG